MSHMIKASMYNALMATSTTNTSENTWAANSTRNFNRTSVANNTNNLKAEYMNHSTLCSHRKM